MVIIETGDPGSPQTEVTCAIETPLVLQEPQSNTKTAVIQSYVEVCCCYPQWITIQTTLQHNGCTQSARFLVISIVNTSTGAGCCCCGVLPSHYYNIITVYIWYSTKHITFFLIKKTQQRNGIVLQILQYQNFMKIINKLNKNLINIPEKCISKIYIIKHLKIWKWDI